MRKLINSTHSGLHRDFAFFTLLWVTLALILSMLAISPAH